MEEWSQLFLTYDNTEVNFYVDNELVFNQETTGTVGDTQGIFIGRYGGGSGYEFPGYIDEVRVYNRALSETEIEALYKAGR